MITTSRASAVIAIHVLTVLTAGVPVLADGLAAAAATTARVGVQLAVQGTHRSYGHHHRYHYRPYGLSLFFGYPSLPYAYDGYRGYGYRGYGYPGYGYPGYGYSGYGYPRYVPYWTPDMGAVDLAVRPKKAQVFLDGDYVGVVDNFDGFPSYLWLRQGAHHLVFYLEGYENYEQDVRVQPGAVVDLKYRMVAGVATPPETDHEGRAREDGDAQDRDYPSRDTAAGDESWRRERDVRQEPARLIVLVAPLDAVAYLDGRLLGSGEELRHLRSALVIDAGAHTLEVARPGYSSRKIEFVAEPGKELTLTADLKADSRL